MRYFLYLAFFVLALPQLCARAAGELPRAGAPRPLRLVASDGAPLIGSPRDVVWESRGGGVFFTLEREGTRNIWRAFPDPQDGSRFPAWRALPVTNLRAPRFAEQPCPLPGDGALVCVSNALAGAPAAGAVSQVVRYDLEKAEFRALSDAILFYDSPQVSPDGTRVAFTGGRNADAHVYEAPAQNPENRVMPFVTRLVTRARRPIWLDDKTLLVEGLTPQARGLYSMPASSTLGSASDQSGGVAASNLIVGGGGEANTLGDNGIVFSAKTSSTSPTNLYFIARDGSGLRVLPETSGARRPAVAPDGQTLAYDAPHGDGRALWVVPILRAENRVAPRVSARGSRFRLCADGAPEYDGPGVGLTSVRATDGGIAVIGRVQSATNSNVTLEVGQGGKPKRWDDLSLISLSDATSADAQGNRILAIWNPPARARGDWTLRLSLRGLGGGAQSLLRVRLPLPTSDRLPLPPPVAPPNQSNATRPTDAATAPLPRATPLPELPDVMPVRGAFLPSPPVTAPAPGNNDNLPGFPTMQAPDTPSFAIPPLLPNVQAPNVTSPLVQAPIEALTTAGVEIVPINPAHLQPPATSPAATSPAVNDDESAYGERPDAPADAPFVAQLDVAGTPARMAPRGKVTVTLRAINRGATTWKTGSDGADRVRLVARWVDFSTGTRRQWNFFWLQESVAPGERTTREFDVPAPARPGKYKLIYGLVHLPANGEYKAPPYSAPQENWNDEFGAIAFAVEVGAK